METNWFIPNTNYVITTITMIYVGRAVIETRDCVTLVGASWIYDTGDYKKFIDEGSIKESIRYPTDLLVNKSSIISAAPWPHDLP